MNKFYNQALLAGYLAFKRGENVHDCPHMIGLRREGWLRGNEIGHEEYMDKLYEDAQNELARARSCNQPYA
jgi:hypothetical protein